MQVARLFEMVYLLLENGRMTAAELSRHFEVSPRTIYRYMETLCQAGIPLYAERGKGGGIQLSERFVLNKSLLSEREQGEILAALQALSAINYPSDILEKLGSLFQKNTASWIEVDFSDWSNTDKDMFLNIRQGIWEHRVLKFEYHSSSGEAAWRSVEPILLWFKHKNWYLRAFCLNRQEERLFKLSRIRHLALLEETFATRVLPIPAAPPAARQSSIVRITLKVAASQLYRLYDEFDERQMEQLDDGSYRCTCFFPWDEWVVGYLLSFGPHAEVLEPAFVREALRERLQASLKYYL